MSLIPVTVDNFTRAETDMYFKQLVEGVGVGTFRHRRDAADVDHQDVVRMNRDTLYSSGVFDLSAGEVTVTLPEGDGRYMALQAIDEDHYVVGVYYGPDSCTFALDQIGTRYLALVVRTFANPDDPADMAIAHRLQDEIRVEQESVGALELPDWDPESLARIRGALKTLVSGGLNPGRAFGARDEVDPIHHLMGTAAGWGGNPSYAASYRSFYPDKNDGRAVHRLTLSDVPVDGFWSVSVYNADGFFVKNALDAYSLNNVTAKQDADGSYTIQFGGCTGGVANCLPIVPGWNYTVRMYRPRPEILDGTWTLPEADAVTP